MKVLICVSIALIAATVVFAQTTEVKRTSSCSYSQYYDPTAKACTNCPSGCSTCIWHPVKQKVSCNRCDTSNSFFAITDGVATCTKCADSCSYCRGPNPQDCIQWNSGHLFHPDKNQSYNCGSHSSCIQCTTDGTNKCAMCANGYYLDATSNTCSYCSGACGKCTVVAGTQTCTVCPRGYYMGVIGTSTTPSCQYCGANCFHCKNATGCWKCSPGYGLKGTTCATCEDTNCQLCNQAAICDSCKVGYYRTAEGKCTQCSTNCTACASADNCTTCQTSSSYHITNNVNGKCVTCKDQYCQSCDANGDCTACKSGYFLKADKTCTTSTCQSNCDLCLNETGCARCMPAYGLARDGRCIYSQWSSCQFKVTDDSGSGYSYACSNYSDDVFCNYAYKAHNETNKTCTQCQNGYYFDRNASSCQACPPGCIECVQQPSGYVKCNTLNWLEYGFVRTNGTSNGTHGDLTGYQCPTGCAKCLEYNTSVCSQCMPGYQMWGALDTGEVRCQVITKECPIPETGSTRCYVTSWNSAVTMLVNLFAILAVKYLYLA